MGSPDDAPLIQLCRRLDGKPWPAYRDLVGQHDLGDVRVHVDGVPPDPFAGGARIRLVVDRRLETLPAAWTERAPDRIAVEDHLARDTARRLAELDPQAVRGARGGRALELQSIGPSVVERSAVRVRESTIELRLRVDLPAASRRIRGEEAARMFDEVLRRLALMVGIISSERKEAIAASIARAADHRALQGGLRDRGLVAFLAEGSLLARASGVDERPRRDGLELPLSVPDDLAVVLSDAQGRDVRGLGIPRGITVIVGGAFHGKSTLLQAIAGGVHARCEGDGRERVATSTGAVTLRAEDGRAVRDVDLSGFFERLPSGIDVSRFSTDRASGSTSQAASLVEALEAGADALLIDEDKAATNFMIRDARMQQLVPRPQESVIPFIDRVRELYLEHGISSVIVTGGSGDYLEVADTVIQMDAYRPVRRSEDARRIVAETGGRREREATSAITLPAPRRFDADADSTSGSKASSRHGGGREMKVGTRGDHAIRVGAETVDLTALDQRVEPGQTAALAALLRHVVETERDPVELPALLDRVEAWLDRVGLDGLERPAAFTLTRPRRFEIAGALNRWRDVRLRQGT